MRRLRKIRLFLWLAVVAFAGIGLALFVSSDLREQVLGPGGPGQGIAAVGGPFSLVDHTGQPVTEEKFLGTPTAYFFGFTHCPDVCPTTLFEMSRWLEELGTDAERLDAVFVTVDPERDGPEEMALYLSSFDERITGLTGDPEAVAAMTRSWRVYVAKVENESDPDGYAVDHTASVYLMDSQGRFFGTIAYGEADDIALQKLRRLIAEG